MSVAVTWAHPSFIQTDAREPLEELAGLLPGGRGGRAVRFEAWARSHGKAYASEAERFHRASLYHGTPHTASVSSPVGCALLRGGLAWV